MKKIFAIMLTVLMLLGLSACAASDAEMDGGAPVPGDSGYGGSSYKAEAAEGAVSGDAEFFAGAADMIDGALMPSEDRAEGDVLREEEYVPEKDSYPTPTAGLLTAGEWKDLENLDFWTTLLNRNDWYSLMEKRDLYPRSIKPVLVTNENGEPCYNAVVELLDGAGQPLYAARTDVSGYAYLFYGIDKQEQSPASVRVCGKVTAPLSEGVTTVVIDRKTVEVQALDLMFMIDTTGSMSDELAYLQKEVEDVVLRVAAASDGVLSIRVSVNFYRDKGDRYVVRPFAFTENLNEVVTTLAAQDANGGGDTPEAVHLALDNAIREHDWREDAVKLMIFVLDAPPHYESEIQGINRHIRDLLIEASLEGIRIIPVASSGVDTDTEFLLRSYAAMTGGTYVFLTDHSGIGNSHLEPTIGQYEVEALNECLIRIISEYCGLEYQMPQ